MIILGSLVVFSSKLLGSSFLFFHVYDVFFFEIPPFEDLLHYKCTTHRGELGRPTPGVSRVLLIEILLD